MLKLKLLVEEGWIDDNVRVCVRGCVRLSVEEGVFIFCWNSVLWLSAEAMTSSGRPARRATCTIYYSMSICVIVCFI